MRVLFVSTQQEEVRSAMNEVSRVSHDDSTQLTHYNHLGILVVMFIISICASKKAK